MHYISGWLILLAVVAVILLIWRVFFRSLVGSKPTVTASSAATPPSPAPPKPVGEKAKTAMSSAIPFFRALLKILLIAGVIALLIWGYRSLDVSSWHFPERHVSSRTSVRTETVTQTESTQGASQKVDVVCDATLQREAFDREHPMHWVRVPHGCWFKPSIRRADLENSAPSENDNELGRQCTLEEAEPDYQAPYEFYDCPDGHQAVWIRIAASENARGAYNATWHFEKIE